MGRSGDESEGRARGRCLDPEDLPPRIRDLKRVRIRAAARGKGTSPLGRLAGRIRQAERSFDLPLRATRILEAGGESLAPGCPACRMRRRRVLLDAAKESGCGVLALGHTLDDFAETLLLNLAYAGSAEGFAPKRLYFGEIAVVRPFILTRKREILPARPGRARS